MFIESISDGLVSSPPTGRAMLQMLAIVAEMERSFITERTIAGSQQPKRRVASEDARGLLTRSRPAGLRRSETLARACPRLHPRSA